MLGSIVETNHFIPKAQSKISCETKTVSTKNTDMWTKLLPIEKKNGAVL